MSLQNIPEELKAFPNWTGWMGEDRAPINLRTGGNAMSNNSATWSTFDVALKKCDELTGEFDGAGIAVPAGYVGFDFDGVVKDGVIEPFVQVILRLLGNPYCELSPSGNGLRAFVRHNGPKLAKTNFLDKTRGKYGIEIYAGSHTPKVLTVTGNHVSGQGVPVLDSLGHAYALCSRILNEPFKKLWLGDTTAQGNDESKADYALLCMLAELTNGNAALMEMYFNSSVRGQREKWTSREDYRKSSIAAALKTWTQKPAAPAIYQRTATLTCGDTLKMRKVYWLWPGRLVGDGLNGFSGEPGVGKSTMADTIAAIVTRGDNFPDSAVNTLGPRSVLIICDEDGREDTIGPRLKLAGADMSRVFFLNIHVQEGTTVEEGEARLDEDLPLIEAKLQEHPDIALIIPDPVTAYLGEADPNLDQEVGPIYNKMLKLAKRTKVAWVLVSHWNKNRHANATNRVSGAKVLVTRPRANWTFAHDPHSTDGRFLMLQGKCNLAQRKTIAFYVNQKNVEVTDDETGEPFVLEDISYIRWDGLTDDKADDVLLRLSDPTDNAETKVKAFLDKVLAEGPKRAHECYELGKAQSVYEETIRKHYRGIAKMQLVINGKTEWWWALDKQELLALKKPEPEKPEAPSIIGAFLAGMIGDGAVPVALLKATAKARGLNWETVTTNRKRLGYTSCEVEGVKSWRKTVVGEQIGLDAAVDDAKDSPEMQPESTTP